jgi:hypothetical protein
VIGAGLLLPAVFFVWWGGVLVSDWNVPVFDSSDDPAGPVGVGLILIGLFVGAAGVGLVFVGRKAPDDPERSSSKR